jgi:hypothetical protein
LTREHMRQTRYLALASLLLGGLFAVALYWVLH